MGRNLPSFHALRAFEATARLGSMTRASQELHLTPSAISHQVRALEDYFGRPLFEVGSRVRMLTDDGTRLAKGLFHAFDSIEQACAEVTPRTSVSTLTVHCSPSFAAKWLGPRLAAFRQRHPEFSIRMSSGAGTYDLALNEGTDVAIVYGEVPPATGLKIEALGVEEVTALCTPDLETNLQSYDRDEIGALPLIESSVSPIRWSDWFSINGLGKHPQVPTTGFDRGALVVSAAVQGMGVALESERFVESELAGGQLVVLGGKKFQPIKRNLHYLLTRAGQEMPHRVRIFRSWLLHELGVQNE